MMLDDHVAPLLRCQRSKTSETKSGPGSRVPVAPRVGPDGRNRRRGQKDSIPNGPRPRSIASRRVEVREISERGEYASELRGRSMKRTGTRTFQVRWFLDTLNKLLEAICRHLLVSVLV